jgi:hypothetical protein
VSIPRPDQALQRVFHECSDAVKGVQDSISHQLDSVAEALYQVELGSQVGELGEDAVRPTVNRPDIP